MRDAKKKATALAGDVALKSTSDKSNHNDNALTAQCPTLARNQAQRDKVLILLRQGPKTTIDLRAHGIMMPATRVFELRNQYGHNILSELVPLFDVHGFRHLKCARYHLLTGIEAGAAS
jgi:hypothetical protein